MSDDAELLRRFVTEGSQAAFTQLVHQHIGPVYAGALRRVGGDAQLAEDVTQIVFAALARKAPRLLGRSSLAGWLHVAMHSASAETVRRELRRKHRETTAHLMHNPTESELPSADWRRIEPLLDEVIVALRDDEREAVLLRFFHQRSFAEIGAALRVSEEAARKRVERALEKLRDALQRRDITSTTAALSTALAQPALALAPAHLAGGVVVRALAHAAATSTLTWSGILGPVIPIAAALSLVSAVVHQSRSNAALREEIARLDAGIGNSAELLAETAGLRRTVAAAEDSRHASRETPAVETEVLSTAALPVAHRAVSARIVVTPENTILWNQEPVTLDEFVTRLRALQASADPNSRVHVQGLGARFDALRYVIDEVRKAELTHLTIESNAAPGGTVPNSWF